MYKVFNRGTGRYEVADYENQKYAATFDKYHEALAFCEYKNSGAVYHFTAEQLQKMLAETISSFIEWRDTHGKDEASAAQCAASEVIEGTNADRELYLSGDDKLKFQLLFF